MGGALPHVRLLDLAVLGGAAPVQPFGVKPHAPAAAPDAVVCLYQHDEVVPRVSGERASEIGRLDRLLGHSAILTVRQHLDITASHEVVIAPRDLGYIGRRTGPLSFLARGPRTNPEEESMKRITRLALDRTSPAMVVAIIALVATMSAGAVAANRTRSHLPSGLMWINPLDLLPGDPSVHTSFNAVNSGVGSGLSGLIVTSSTTGDIASGGGNKVIETGVDVPPGYQVTGVRVCYQVSAATTFLDQIRLAQVQNPPSSATIMLDDATHQPTPGPVCVNSAPTSIDASAGGLLLSLRLNFGSTAHEFVLRSLALKLASK
jgi:hypothetical protein